HNALADSYACARILIAENEHFGEAQTKAMMKLAKAG
ncbi:DNA polymerase III subunit alpha, partial [Lacticaseibacillus rhamnosus]